jgi:hypothetical protein
MTAKAKEHSDGETHVQPQFPSIAVRASGVRRRGRARLGLRGSDEEALVMVEDPDTFDAPLYMVQRWRKVKNPLLETACAENNGNPFGKNLFPIPQADTPDF